MWRQIARLLLSVSRWAPVGVAPDVPKAIFIVAPHTIIDYGRKRVGIVRRLDLTDDAAADLKICADFYAEIKGRRPEKTTPVRLEQ